MEGVMHGVVTGCVIAWRASLVACLGQAMRASIEESRVTTTAGDRPAGPGQTPGPGAAVPAAAGGDGMDLDEEAMLQAALELSMAGVRALLLQIGCCSHTFDEHPACFPKATGCP